MPAISLGHLLPGDSAKVVNVWGEEGVCRRLMDMGLVRGTVVRIVKVAPLGDPMELEVLGYHLSLRRDDAHCIRVVALEGQNSELPVSS